jgi:glycosyltransferase involved in cell wall biosynthesis
MEEGIEGEFMGFVPDPGAYLSDASVALTSGYLAMLEAMAHRRPVFSVYHTPVKADYLQLMPGAGELFTVAADADQLAVQLRAALLGRHDLRRQVKQAFEFASRQTWSTLADAYEELWGQR